MYSRGLTKLAAWGEKVTPARREITLELSERQNFSNDRGNTYKLQINRTSP